MICFFCYIPTSPTYFYSMYVQLQGVLELRGFELCDFEQRLFLERNKEFTTIKVLKLCEFEIAQLEENRVAQNHHISND